MNASRLAGITALLLALLVAGACTSDDASGAGATTAGDGRDIIPERTFRFTYTVAIPAPPAGTKSLSGWVPIPMQDPGVQETGFVDVEAPRGWRITTDPIFGNRMIHFTVANPSGATHVSWSATVRRREDRGQGSLPVNDRYLAPTSRIPVDGVAAEIARRLGVMDKSKSVHERARIIYDDVLNSMEYDKTVPGYGFGDFHRSVTVCKGNCTDFHARFIGVARAAGIPVRFTMGIPMKPAPTGRYNSYHCWAHYFDGSHWYPVDISEADKVAATDPEKADWFFGHLDENRLALSFGRDVVLEPPQKGAPLNYFVFPYVEVDGKEFTLTKENWEFTWEDVD